MALSFAYDVFLSYAPTHAPIMNRLAGRLRADGLRVFQASTDLDLDVLRDHAADRALRHSRTLVCADPWAFRTALYRDDTDPRRRLIPILVHTDKLTGPFKNYAFIDWREESDDEYKRLFTACCAPAEEAPVLPSHTSFMGHSRWVRAVAISATGTLIVSGADDSSVKLWDVQAAKEIATLQGHRNIVTAVGVAERGDRAVSCSFDGTIRVWNVLSRACEAVIGKVNTTPPIVAAAMTPDCARIATRFDMEGFPGESTCDTSGEEGEVSFTEVVVQDLPSGNVVGRFERNHSAGEAVAISRDGNLVAMASKGNSVDIYDLSRKKRRVSLRGHQAPIRALAFTPTAQQVISASNDLTVKIWDVAKERCVATLEGHTDFITGVAVMGAGRFIVSGSKDATIRIWDLQRRACVADIPLHDDDVTSVAATDDGHYLSTGSKDTTVRVMELSHSIVNSTEVAHDTWYTNAKVLLVGDTGVGKTGLAKRLSQGTYEPTDSTDGAWATQVKLDTNDRTAASARDIWLWDFAGQSDYRLIHQLFFDETSLAVFVFNPQSDDPFDVVRQWDRSIRTAAQRPFAKLLVAGRCDRGGVTVANDVVRDLMTERAFSDYVETSARTGAGCEDLLRLIAHNIDWEAIPWTVSPPVFKALKVALLELRDEGRVLMRMGELKQQLEMRLPAFAFTIEDLRAVIGLLVSPGIVWTLDFGDFVLLQPEWINAYACAMIRSVRSHSDEIGCITEDDLTCGRLKYEQMNRLPQEDEAIVLRAMYHTFVRRGLCIRERTSREALLVFPSYFKRERPVQEEHPTPLVTYECSGALEEVYATLVVRLLYADAFEKEMLWRFAADFMTPSGKRIGLKMNRGRESRAEVTVYCEDGVPDDTKVVFLRYVHEHLMARAHDIVRVRHYACGHCGMPVESTNAVRRRLEQGLKDIVCTECEKRVDLWDVIERKYASEKIRKAARKLLRAATEQMDNESKELILVGIAYTVAGEAGHIFRKTPNSDWGIDGEIEFKDKNGNASGQRVYLQLKSGASHVRRRKDGSVVFRIAKARHAEYWQKQAYPVMLVVRVPESGVRWMDVSAYLRRRPKGKQRSGRLIVFNGEEFNAENVQRMQDQLRIGVDKERSVDVLE